MRIAIFGSAFNPPHNGHIEGVECVRRILALDRIIFMPTHTPPHKKRPEVKSKDRLRMARLAIQGRPKWRVSDIEIRKKGISYTLNTIRKLQKMYPRDEIFWIIGMDNLIDMKKKWRGGYSLLRMCRFVVISRPGYSIKSIPLRIRKQIIILSRCVSPDISSTEVRSKIKEGKDVSMFLQPRVYNFIKKHRLYGYEPHLDNFKNNIYSLRAI